MTKVNITIDQDKQDMRDTADAALTTLQGHIDNWESYTAGEKASATKYMMQVVKKLVKLEKKRL